MNTDFILKLPLNTLKKGYIESDFGLECIICNKKFEKGRIYSIDNKQYLGERYIHYHIQNEHSSVFDYFVGLDKKIQWLNRPAKKKFLNYSTWEIMIMK